MLILRIIIARKFIRRLNAEGVAMVKHVQPSGRFVKQGQQERQAEIVSGSKHWGGHFRGYHLRKC